MKMVFLSESLSLTMCVWSQILLYYLRIISVSLYDFGEQSMRELAEAAGITARKNKTKISTRNVQTLAFSLREQETRACGS
jgi:hypothetical protein